MWYSWIYISCSSQLNLYFMFISLNLSIIKIKFQWSIANNLSVKYFPFKVFLNLKFRSTVLPERPQMKILLCYTTMQKFETTFIFMSLHVFCSVENICIYYIGDEVDISRNIMHCYFEYTKTKPVFICYLSICL